MGDRMFAGAKIYDSRKGDDWIESTRRGERFSIRQYNFLLIRYTAVKGMLEFDLYPLDDFVKISMQNTGSIGFFSLSSVNDKLRDALIDSKDLIEVQGSPMGYFPLEDRLIDQYLRLRQDVTFQAYILGSARQQLATPTSNWKTYAWDIDYLFDQIDRVGCFCRFDGETTTLEIFTRIYEGLDEALERL